MTQDSQKRSALFVASLTAFLTPFMGSAVNIALPAVAREFEMDAVQIGWVAMSYLLAAAMFLVPFGRLADIHGRKLIFTWGICVYTLGSLLCGVSVSPTMLIASRVLQGIGGSMIFGTGIAILTSVFPVGERGRALGIAVAFVYLGLSLGPPAGGFLTQQFGWRSVFILNVPLGIMVIAAAVFGLKGEWAEAKGERFDILGSVTYSLALVALMYGLSSLPSAWAVWLILLGFALLLAFIWWETKTKSPVFEMALFRSNRVFAFSSLAALINYGATFSIGFLLSLYLQYIKGFSPQDAGVVLVAQPIIQAAFSPLAGRISDRIEPRLVASAGMTLTTLGLVLLMFLNGDTSIAYIVACLIILGFGFALFSSPNTNAIMSSVERRNYGVASGTVATMRLLGFMLSMGLVMLLFALFMGRVQITPEYHALFLKSVRTAFAISSILCFAGIFASMARGKLR